MPDFMACWHAENLADGRACSCAHGALLHGVGGGGGGRGLAHLARGPHIGLADRQGRNRMAQGTIGTTAAPVWKADAAMLQIASHPGRRFEAKRAAAGQHDGVHAVGDVRGPQHVDLLGAGGRAADIHAADGAAIAQNHGAAGERVVVRRMSHANARNVCKSFRSCMVASRTRWPRFAWISSQNHSDHPGFLSC